MSSGSSGIRVTVPEPSRSMFLDFCFMVEMRTGGIRYGGALAVRAYIENKWTIKCLFSFVVGNFAYNVVRMIIALLSVVQQ